MPVFADWIGYEFSLPVLTGIGLVLLLTLLMLLLRRRRRKPQIRQMERLLARLKKDEVRGIVIPDGIGGLLEIERLILTDQGLLVLQSYEIGGHLFGAEHINEWTQIINGRSYKFANPLRHVHNAGQALQLLAPRIPVYCRVVFTADSDFPKGRPEGVSLPATLEQDLQPLLRAAPMADRLTRAWQTILRIARKNGQAVMRETVS